MPHIPRSIAPTDLRSIAANTPKQPKVADKKPIQYRPEKPTTDQNHLLGKKLNIKDWDFNPVTVLKLMTGKEAKADEYSGLVSRPS